MNQWFSRYAALWWWSYSVLILSLGYGRMVQKLLSDTGGIGARYAPPLAATVLVWVVLAAVYRRPWLWRPVWLISYWLVCVSAGLITLWLTWLVLAGGAPLGILGWVCGLCAVLLPGLNRWYAYVHHMPDIWRERSGD